MNPAPRSPRVFTQEMAESFQSIAAAKQMVDEPRPSKEESAEKTSETKEVLMLLFEYMKQNQLIIMKELQDMRADIKRIAAEDKDATD
jgi:hypothetical protein